VREVVIGELGVYPVLAHATIKISSQRTASSIVSTKSFVVDVEYTTFEIALIYFNPWPVDPNRGLLHLLKHCIWNKGFLREGCGT